MSSSPTYFSYHTTSSLYLGNSLHLFQLLPQLILIN